MKVGKFHACYISYPILTPPYPFSISPSPCLPMHNPLSFLFHLCCCYSALCHSFHPFRKSCLFNPFPYATLPFATSLATLGSYAYPIFSCIFPCLCHHPLLFAILNPLCLISLKPSMLPCLLIILRHSMIFYNTSCLSLLTDTSCTFYYVLLLPPWIF